MALGRVLATAALAAVLVLSQTAQAVAQVDAAPPEDVPETAAEPSPPDVVVESDPSLSLPEYSSALPDTEEDHIADVATRDRAKAETGSVRPRGQEAPVELSQQAGQGADQRQKEEEDDEKADTSEDEERDPGDGRVRNREQTSRPRDRAPREIRVWPMPAESYTFTQQFGCVPQLGNLYFPGAGCPAGAPVIHTGVDLAAPEGTPFYAAASGWVTLADFDRPTADANTRIIIQHDGRNERFATDYLHWIASYVEEGDYVRAGDPIGEVGSVGYSTGPHLHFSVTDLDTGEHVDPLRWLPDEPGLEGYVTRSPRARLRLPAGTTAGQPESADPAPPPPPVREDVPESPPDENGERRDRSEQKSDRKREERRAENRDEAAGKQSDRSGKKRDREEATADTNRDEPAEESKNERTRSRERERTRERDKDGSRSESSDSGEDGRARDRRDESGSRDQRRDRDADDDSGGGGKQNRDRDRAGRDEREDTGSARRDDRGRDQAGGRDRSDGGGKGDDGEGRNRDKRVKAADDADAVGDQ